MIIISYLVLVTITSKLIQITNLHNKQSRSKDSYRSVETMLQILVCRCDLSVENLYKYVTEPNILRSLNIYNRYPYLADFARSKQELKRTNTFIKFDIWNKSYDEINSSFSCR